MKATSFVFVFYLLITIHSTAQAITPLSGPTGGILSPLVCYLAYNQADFKDLKEAIRFEVQTACFFHPDITQASLEQKVLRWLPAYKEIVNDAYDDYAACCARNALTCSIVRPSDAQLKQALLALLRPDITLCLNPPLP